MRATPEPDFIIDAHQLNRCSSAEKQKRTRCQPVGSRLENSDEITLVLIDMAMPVMGGEEALRAMRKLRPETRILLTSGFGEEDVVERFRGAGLAGFVHKPYDSALLGKHLQELL